MKDYKPYQGSESDFQKTLAKYLDSVGLDWFHPANGELRNKITASKLKAMGVKAGVPDIIIINSIHRPTGKFNGMCMELKVGKNKQTMAQLIWESKFKSNEWIYNTYYSLDQAIEDINFYYEI